MIQRSLQEETTPLKGTIKYATARNKQWKKGDPALRQYGVIELLNEKVTMTTFQFDLGSVIAGGPYPEQRRSYDL